MMKARGVMKFRIASYNVENLFERPAVMNLPDWSDGKPVLDNYAKLNDLLQKPTYTADDKQKILALLKALGLGKSDESKYVILRQNRGHLLKRPKSGAPVVVANGRGDWIGWLELKWETVNETALATTGRVIRDVDAQIQGVVEVEGRVALKGFNEQFVGKDGGRPYEHVMVIDGNDERGIDVGLMTRGDFPIVSMRSHVDDMSGANPIFSRDCAEYEIGLPGGDSLWILMNHFKSKGYGDQKTSNAKRKLQADRTLAIYQDRLKAGAALISVMGDFNDTSDSAPLAGLLAAKTGLRDIFEHPKFAGDGRPGTFGNGAKSNKIDFILLSPELWKRVTGGGVFRKGVWGGKNGTLFPHYPEITKAEEAASDHAAIWAELNL
ncbi:MAG TPA: endonuclease/exonuclease/phosphatase family protein [Dongiaceae bacterium]